MGDVCVYCLRRHSRVCESMRVSSDLSFEEETLGTATRACAVHVRVHVHVQLNCNSAMFCSALHCCPHSSYSPCAKPTQK